MAYIVNVTQTATAVAATYTVTLGAHVSGDLLLVCLSQDGGGTAITPDATATTAGWAMIGTGAASQGCRGQWAYLIADSSSEVNPTFTGANDDWIGTCLVVRDADPSTPFGSLVDGTDYKKADWGNSTNISYGDSGALTTAVDECLLIYSWCSDGGNQFMRCNLSELNAVDKYATGFINHIIGYRQQQTAAAAPTVRMYSVVATEGGTGWVLAIRNKSGGALAPMVREVSAGAINEIVWHGSWESTHDSVTWQAPSSFAASINSITCSTTVPTKTATNPAAQTPWGYSSGLSATESTSPCFGGGTFAISSTDMTGKVFGIQWAMLALSTNAFYSTEGVLVGFASGATNWVVYQLASRAKGWGALTEYNSFIALGNATPYRSSTDEGGGAIDWSAVTRIGYFVHRGSATAINSYFRNATLFGNVAITGGGSARPLTFVDYHTQLNSWGVLNWSELQGSSQIKPKTSVQIGDGTNYTYFDGATGSIGYPQAWSATANTNWQMDWNVDSGRVTLGVKAGSGDTIYLAAGAATSANAQLLTIASDSNSGATYDFAQSFGGFSVTWDTDIPCSNATFTGGGQVLGKGADFTNCIFKNSTAGTTEAVLGIDANGSVLAGCTTVATTSTGYHIELGTAVTAITLADHTFSGSALTDKIHVLKTSGTVTITISGTTSLVAGDVTSAGATVVISAPVEYQSVTLSNYVTGSRIQIYDTTNGVELYNDIPAAAPQTLWTDSVAASTSGARDIRVRVAYVSGTTAKSFIEAAIGTVASSGSGIALSYRVNQTDDDTYNSNAVDGSAVTGITIVEGSTDRVQISIAGGSVSWAQIYAYQCWWLFDSVGITDDGAFIEAPDTANYILTGFKIKNTHASIPLLITGGYGVDSTGSVSALYDTTGTSIFPAPAHVVPYATGSGVTPGDVTDIAAASAAAAATAVWGDSKALTVPKFLGLK